MENETKPPEYVRVKGNYVGPLYKKIGARDVYHVEWDSISGNEGKQDFCFLRMHDDDLRKIVHIRIGDMAGIVADQLGLIDVFERLEATIAKQQETINELKNDLLILKEHMALQIKCNESDKKKRKNE